GTDRIAAARALLVAHPECEVLISDDGLQHYRLRRDIEIAVVDGTRGFGNGCLLPAGPLREPVSRLTTVDAIVIKQTESASTVMNDIVQLAPQVAAFEMRLTGDSLVNVTDQRTMPLSALRGKTVHALAGIADPTAFFTYLRSYGLEVIAHPFPDHHEFA